MKSLLTVSVVLVTALGAVSGSMVPTIVVTDKAPMGPGGAAQGLVDAAGFLTTSLQYGTGPEGALAPGGAKRQMRQAMSNVAHVFAAAGLNFTTDATDCWLYGFNSSTFGDISGVYDTFFPTLSHPARNPTGAILAAPVGSEIGVQCRGFPNGGLRVRPQDFFLSDFNAQAVVAGGSTIFTAGQLGMDPASGQMASGGAFGQAKKALDNIGTVYAFVMPELAVGGNNEALRQRAVHCQIMINASIFDYALAGAMSALEKVFEGAPMMPPVTVRSQPSHALPLVADVAITCPGVTSLVSNRTRIASLSNSNHTLAVVSHYSVLGRTYHNLHSSPIGGTSFDVVFGNMTQIFQRGLATILQQSATFCEIIATNGQFAQHAAASFTEMFVAGKAPPLVATVARFPGDQENDFTLQCSGTTAV